MAYNSGLNLDDLLVPVKAGTIFAAQESSLFMGGALIPTIQAPNGVAKVPALASVNGSVISAEGVTDDLAALAMTDSSTLIQCNLYGARSVIRDLGNVDTGEIGRVLGNAVAKSFDTAVMGALEAAPAATAVTATVDDLIDTSAEIRANGEFGKLYAIVSPAIAASLMKEIGNQSYAGGDFQTEVLRSGFIGDVAGVSIFVSAYVTGKAVMFSSDAARIAMQGGMNVEAGRRVEAVGFDVVASLHAGVALVDTNRALKIA